MKLSRINYIEYLWSRFDVAHTKTRLRLGWVLCFCAVAKLVTLPSCAYGEIAGSCPVLTLDSAVGIAMQNSYRIRKLELDIARTRAWLLAQKAALRSRVYLNVTSPDLKNVSDFRWDSDAQKDVMVRENKLLVESQLTVRQPVIFFGYPTNGFVSLNYKVNRNQQLNAAAAVNPQYYNNLYLKFEQPLFQPNLLRNDIDEARLNLEESMLRYAVDRTRIAGDVGRHYYRVLYLVYRDKVYREQITLLDSLLMLASCKETADRSYDSMQVALECGGLREQFLENQSLIRRELDAFRQRIGLNQDDSLRFDLSGKIDTATVDLVFALEKGFALNPGLKQLAISKRKAEIRADEVRGYNSFLVKLEVTYGLENTDEKIGRLWETFSNSNSARLNAYIPLLDWGERRERIRCEQINVDKRTLEVVESREILERDICSVHITMVEYNARCRNLQAGLPLAAEYALRTIERFNESKASVTDAVGAIGRYADSQHKMASTLIEYRKAFLELELMTYFDFERGVSLLDALDVEGSS